MTPVLDMTLSFGARGVIAYLLAAQRSSATVQEVRKLGLGRDIAYRVCYELEIRGYFLKSGKSSYIFLDLESSGVELPEIRSSGVELPNFLNSGNQEDQHLSYIESSDQNQRGVANVETFQIQEVRKFNSEPIQEPLVGLPEPPPPSSAAPPPPPKKPKRENPAEARALYPLIFDLCKSGPHGGLANGCRTIARNLWRDFQATPEQVTGYAEWRKTFSFEASSAARERRPLRPALPRFIYEDWRTFREWWDAKQAAVARAEEARRQAEAEAAAQVAPPIGDTPRLSGRELYRRTFGLPRPATPPTAD